MSTNLGLYYLWYKGERIIMEKVNIAQHFSKLQETWSSAVVGELNDAAIKLEKLQGEFAWQQNDQKDELF
ncbi:hypothetical protein SB775_28820, partial [Peribacillus sp. SIMBA_075]